MMNKKYFNATNIALAAVLIIVCALKEQNLIVGIGYAVASFFFGVILVGLVIMGLFMFFYNIFRPDNKIKLGIPERITAGLIGAILWTLIIKK